MLKNKTYIKAFSVIELLVAIVIVAVILLIAMPSWQGMISKNRALAYANELTTALQFARVAAIKFGEPVNFFCDGLWKNGSIVAMAKGDKIIRVLPPIFAGDKLSWNGNFFITFSPTGLSNGQQGSFYYCPLGSSEHAVVVILSPTGRARISNRTYDGKIIPCNF